MKISTKGRYGLRAVIDLALYSERTHIPLTEVAKRQDISELYLEQIFSVLRKAGIVGSFKGPQGGYFIAQPLAYIRVGDILRPLEGDLTVMDDSVKMNLNTRSITYLLKAQLWENVDKAVNLWVDGTTLEDLVGEIKKKSQDCSGLMYYI